MRPIMLLQAQPEFKDRASITVDAVVAKLRDFGVREDEICVHTGDRRGLDGIDVMTRECPVRFIITVQALKEGWDCPWAYVLFSVAEMGSSKAVEQILGRVLRMPRAKRKGRDDLNHAYAFVASTRFDDAAKALKDGLIASGFEGQDVADLVVERPLLPPTPSETTQPADAPVIATLPDPPATALPMDVIDAVTWNPATRELTVEKKLTPDQETAIVTWAGDGAAGEAVRMAINRRAGRLMGPAGTSGVMTGCRWTSTRRSPCLCWPLSTANSSTNSRKTTSSNAIIGPLAKCDADLPGFLVPTEQRGIVIDIEKHATTERETLQSRFSGRSRSSAASFWSRAQRGRRQSSSWRLPGRSRTLGLTDAEIDIWLQRVVAGLEARGITLAQMTAHRHRLFKAVATRVNELEKSHRKVVYETLLFGDGSGTVYVTLANVFTFHPDKYPVGERYHGLALPRHYYKEIGAMNDEEIKCAQVIAHDGRVEAWVRNLEREPKYSFWIQTSSDKFYPDFVAKLENGKVLAVEYKGAHLAGTPDTVEKERLGKLWEVRSEGQCFFEMVKGPSELGKIPDALKAATA